MRSVRTLKELAKTRKLVEFDSTVSEDVGHNFELHLSIDAEEIENSGDFASTETRDAHVDTREVRTNDRTEEQAIDVITELLWQRKEVEGEDELSYSVSERAHQNRMQEYVQRESDPWCERSVYNVSTEPNSEATVRSYRICEQCS